MNIRLVRMVLFALGAAVLALAALAAVRWIRGGDTVSAQQVAQRAQAAQSRLLEGLAPDTTLHVVQLDYEPKPGASTGPFVLPERRRTEYRAYFGPDGDFAGMVSETRDQDTGTIVQTAEWARGTLVITDTASQKTQEVPLAGSTSGIRGRLDALQAQSWDVIAADQQARTQAVDGKDAYVVGLSWAGGVQRTYVAKTDYRTLRWERMTGNTLVESRDTPVFEILPGRQIPGDSAAPESPSTPAPTPDAPAQPSGGAAIAVGAPSLVAGKVRIPVSTTGTGLAPYTAFSLHLRWSPAVFAFASASSAGSVLPGSPFCPPAQVDADGAGVTFACTALGAAQTATAGLLATLTLTPVGTGCSPLHLFTYGGSDGGDSGSGTYAAGANQAVVLTATTDGRANQAGQSC